MCIWHLISLHSLSISFSSFFFVCLIQLKRLSMLLYSLFVCVCVCDSNALDKCNNFRSFFCMFFFQDLIFFFCLCFIVKKYYYYYYTSTAYVCMYEQLFNGQNYYWQQQQQSLLTIGRIKQASKRVCVYVCVCEQAIFNVSPNNHNKYRLKRKEKKRMVI